MRNLEAKFAIRDLARTRRIAERLGYIFRTVIEQHDTFFCVRNGKLKLREQSDGAWLIYYQRVSSRDLQLSNYQIVPVVAPDVAREMLSAALGVITGIRKSRILMLRENIRLHLDNIAGLGTFGEIEAVIADNDSPESCRALVRQTLEALGVGTADLITQSYFELLLATAPQ